MKQKCDRCQKYYLFMKLYPLNSYDIDYDGWMVCEQCLEDANHTRKDKRIKRLI